MKRQIPFEAQPFELDGESQDIGRSGRWFRRGSSIVVLPRIGPLSGDEGVYELSGGSVPSPTPRVLTYSTKDVIDSRISIPAQHSLVRLSKNLTTQADAVGMLEEVKAGRLAGIFCANWQKAALRAQRFGQSWWTVIPQGKDAVLLLDPDDPLGGPPLITYRRELDPDCGLLKGEKRFAPSPARLDAALLKVWSGYQRIRAGELVKCPVAPQDGAILTEISSCIPLDIVVPPVLGQLRLRRFVVELEEPGITPQASEAATSWKNVEVTIRRAPGDVTEKMTSVGDGQFSSVAGAAALRVIDVSRQGPHTHPIRWQMLRGGNTPLQPSPPQNVVAIQPRLRLSVIDFNASFAKRVRNAKGRLVRADVDTKQLDLFKTSRIDDYTLVNTIFFAGQNKAHDANPPNWKGFGPVQPEAGRLNADELRMQYLQRLIEEMHQRGQQVIVGYALDEGAGGVTSLGTNFRDWLKNARAEQVTAHAQAIVDFFKRRSLDIDGIDFDLEINLLGAAHATNIALLYRETAKAMVAFRKEASVSYDNADFQTSDGSGALSWFKAQPYSLAASAPNMIARPMHNLNGRADKTRISNSIAVALRKGSGGGGLHPSQLQFFVDIGNTPGASVETICKDVLLPNRVGLVMYNFGLKSLSLLVAAARNFDAALNSGMPAPGVAGGQPFQVPLQKAKT